MMTSLCRNRASASNAVTDPSCGGVVDRRAQVHRGELFTPPLIAFTPTVRRTFCSHRPSSPRRVTHSGNHNRSLSVSPTQPLRCYNNARLVTMPAPAYLDRDIRSKGYPPKILKLLPELLQTGLSNTRKTVIGQRQSQTCFVI